VTVKMTVLVARTSWAVFIRASRTTSNATTAPVSLATGSVMMMKIVTAARMNTIVKMVTIKETMARREPNYRDKVELEQ